MDKVNIICMKWGDKFPSEYVNRLYSMVNRNLSLPFRFVCFTEDDSGIRNEVEVQPLPKLDLPNNAPERGWRKLTVFKKDFGGLSGKTLFLDLDVVIVDNIDVFFTVEDLKGNDRLRFTMPYKRLTYSDGNLSPHFIQMIFTLSIF
jgi:hypothetical protein